MSDYITIKDTVAKFLRLAGGAEALSLIPTFIEMAETRIYRKLRLPSMENIVDLTTDMTDGFVVLPSDYLETKSIYVQSSDPQSKLEQRPFDEVESTSDTGVPCFFARKDNQLIFSPAPDSQYTIRLYYYRAFDPLTAASPDNFLSNCAQDLLIYGALLEASPYLADLDRGAALSRVWGQKFDAAMADIQFMAEKAEYSGNGIRVRAG